MLKGWKTLAFNLALIAIPVIDYVTNNGQASISPAWLLGIGAVGIVLRAVTTTPIGKS